MNKNPVIIGSIWMLGTVFSLSAIAVCARELGNSISAFEMVFFRSLFGLLVLTPLVFYQNRRFPRTKLFSGHVLRNVTHYLGQYAWFYGIAYLSLAQVFAIEFTTPMWTLILAAFMLGEKITRWRVTALVLGLIGVLVVLRPGVVPVQFASLVVIGGSLCFALSHIYTRRLAQQESAINILFYMSLIQVPLSLVPALASWTLPVGIDWMWIVFMGLTSLTAHYCLNRALAVADASVIIPLDFLRLPLIIVVGYLFYQEAIDWFVLLGACIIFAGNTLSLRKEYQSEKSTN